MPAGGRISYGTLEGDEWGLGVASDIVRLLCEALDEAPGVTDQLDTPEELFSAFDRAKNSLDPVSESVAVLAGDWVDVEVALRTGEHRNFVPAWQIPEADPREEWGEYRGHTFLRGPMAGERRMYLVEPGSWGCFVRARYEGEQDLRIDVNPISPARAQELLNMNSDHFPDVPAYEDKLRKWQTRVELAVRYRVEFRVMNSSRAIGVVSQGSGGDPPA